MDSDLLFFLGLMLFYLVRKFSNRGGEPGRTTQRALGELGELGEEIRSLELPDVEGARDIHAGRPRIEAVEHTSSAPDYAEHWHSAKTSSWSDQTSDFGFHSALERRETAVSHKDQAASVTQSELDQLTRSRQNRPQLDTPGKLREAIILNEVLSPPVSRRTRKVRHRPS